MPTVKDCFLARARLRHPKNGVLIWPRARVEITEGLATIRIELRIAKLPGYLGWQYTEETWPHLLHPTYTTRPILILDEVEIEIADGGQTLTTRGYVETLDFRARSITIRTKTPRWTMDEMDCRDYPI